MKGLAVIVGASPKQERFSNKALRLLREHGYPVVPIHPLHKEIEGEKAVKSLSEISETVDTVTMYVNAGQSSGMLDALTALKPRRIIFNPGAENPTLARELSTRGIEVVEDCTLVMLRTGRY